MCIQDWQTVNEHHGNEHLPFSFSLLTVLSSSSFPVIIQHGLDTLFTSSSSWCVTLCHSSLFSPAFLIVTTSTFPLCHCCFVCFSSWVRASPCFLSCRYLLAAQPSSASELLQEPHRTWVLNIPASSSGKSSRSPSSQSPISIQLPIWSILAVNIAG